MYYYTQMIGDAVEVPTIKATAGFQGMAVVDANVSTPSDVLILLD